MSAKCGKLHEIISKLKRYHFPFDEASIPRNGIYVLFEKNEKGHCGDRIVRIGSHMGENNLRSRLKEHFVVENKDRSIFRKNIGRALLNKNKDKYIEKWELDLTTRQNKERYEHIIDKKRQEMIEKEVSKIIRENFTFSVIDVETKKDRVFYEARIIAEVSKCVICGPSKRWIGYSSTLEKIRGSGLWQVQKLYKESFSLEELETFAKKVEVSV